MEKTPPEIFSKIINCLDAPLAPYSTISRDWQCHIEARTMAEIHVQSDDASQLDIIFEDARRRGLLKSLSSEIILPSYNPLRWSKVPGRRECLQNNTAFTRELRDLFTKLHTYDEEDGATPFCLELGVSCPVDSYEPPLTQFQTDGTGDNRNNNTYIYFDPVEQEPLPILTKVIEFNSHSRRKLHSTILGLILRSLPAVEKVYWQFTGPDVRLLDLRRDLRTSLAHALLNTSLFSLRELHLYWSDAQCSNQSFYAGSLLNPDTGVDELSVALRKIAQLSTIKTLRLGGAFLLSPEFFYFTNPNDDNLPASWPSLEVLDLELSSMTPAGDWYYTGDPSLADISEERSTPSDEEELNSSDSETEDNPATWNWKKLNGDKPYFSWRRQPDASFDLFLLELTRSIPQMPAIRRLTCEMGRDTQLVIDVEFLSAREKPGGMIKYVSPRKEYTIYNWPHWEVVLRREDEPANQKTVWEIPEELKQAWKYTTGSHGSIHIDNGGQRLEL